MGPARLAATISAFLILATGRRLTAQSNSDSAYAGVQSRGAAVMGVDQYSSHHVFEDLPDGGRIVLLRDDVNDSAGAAIILAHLRRVADSFAAGNFTDPSLVHAREVPGTTVMTRLHDRIRYVVSERTGGGELRITTQDSDARQAIHQFLAFQRQDHRAPGHEGMEHHHPPS